MPSNTTDVGVANIALDWLKEGIINDFDDDRPAGRWMKRNFVPVRDMTLCLNPWRFAVQRHNLPEAATIPAFGYFHQYLKPDGCLRVLPLRYGGATNGALMRYSVEGDYILTDSSAPLKCRTIQQVADPTKWSPLFIDAFSLQLALRLGNWLTGKETFVARIAQAYKEASTMAIFTDSAEGYAEDQVADAYDSVRYW
jgi:hypothetical protein